jgi:hypothetical protein
MSGDNNTVYGLARFSWAEFDRLPAHLKQVLNYGVFDMGTDYIVGRLNEGEDPRDLAAELETLDASQATRKARETYGPAHPQAKPPRRAPPRADNVLSPFRIVARNDLSRWAAGRDAPAARKQS